MGGRGPRIHNIISTEKKWTKRYNHPPGTLDHLFQAEGAGEMGSRGPRIHNIRFSAEKKWTKRYNYPPGALDLLFQAHLAEADRICMLAEARSVGRGVQTSWLYGRDALAGAWNIALKQAVEKEQWSAVVKANVIKFCAL